MAENTPTPSPALEGKYQVVGIQPGEVETGGKHGRVDLRTISLATATALVATGNFPYLKAIDPPASDGAPVEEPSGETAAEKAADSPTGPTAPKAAKTKVKAE